MSTSDTIPVRRRSAGGTARLTLTLLRRERWQLLFWVGGICLLVLATGSAIVTQFADEAERAAIVGVAVANPSFLFLRGAPDGAGTGAVFFFQGFTFLAVLAGLMSIFMTVRNTRAEEDQGRSELLGSTPLGRSSTLLAALTVTTLANALLAVGITLVLLALGYDATGSVLTGLATAAVGVVFTGVAAVAAQIMPSSRGANGLSAALVGAAYLLRGIGDALGTPTLSELRVEPAWVSWLSPIGWSQRVAPFTAADPAPLVLSLGAAILLGGVAVAVRARRDLGASLLQQRRGRSRATVGGRSALGLAWRLQRSTVVGWAVAAAVLGLIAGSLAPVVASAIADTEGLAQLIQRLQPGTSGDAVDVFTTAILGMCGALAAAAGIQAVTRPRSEEADGRAETLLATPVTRTGWLLGHVLVAVISVLVVTTVAGLAAGFGFLVSGEGGEGGARFLTSLEAALANTPAALTLVGLAVLLYALIPRLAVALSWGALVLALVLGQFGELLGLPLWLQDASPFRHTSAVPLETLDVTAVIVLTVIAAVAVAGGVAWFRRRNVPAV